MSRYAKDRTGFRKEKLLVLERNDPTQPLTKHGLWKCKCDCGKIFLIEGKRLTKFRSPKSCGCFSEELAGRAANKRGRTPREACIHAQYKMHVGTGKEYHNSFLSRADWESIVFKPCFYCGEIDIRTIPECKRKYGKYFTLTPEIIEQYRVRINGVDRTNSDIGYQPDNCVPCCRMCNIMKNGYFEEDFFQRIKRIYEKHRLDGVTLKPIGETQTSFIRKKPTPL